MLENTLAGVSESDGMVLLTDEIRERRCRVELSAV